MVIYQLTNKTNGKVYVGQTHLDLSERLRCHRQRAGDERRRSLQAISMAIHKYGWEVFDVQVLQTCTDRDELDLAETEWISRLDCVAPNGYNLKGGGSSPRHSEETKRKIGDGNRGKGLHPNTLAALLVANEGVPRSEETKAKISRAFKGKVLSDEHRAKIRDGHLRSRKQRKKLSDAQVAEIRSHKAAGITGRELSSRYGVSEGMISMIVNQRTRRYVAPDQLAPGVD